jgi:four helix bundle protein
MGDYRRLKVWDKAHRLTCATFSLARVLPRSEQFVLGDQMRRAAVSIGANIAEGCGRNGDGDLRRFLNISLGSTNELRYLLQLTIDLRLIPGATGAALIDRTDEVRRMLSALTRAASPHRGTKNKKARPDAAPSLIADS